jgi:hypothetical protein
MVYRVGDVASPTDVEVEFLYPFEKESMHMADENVLYSSPILLTETGYALLDSPELARVRDS